MKILVFFQLLTTLDGIGWFPASKSEKVLLCFTYNRFIRALPFRQSQDREWRPQEGKSSALHDGQPEIKLTIFNFQTFRSPMVKRKPLTSLQMWFAAVCSIQIRRTSATHTLYIHIYNYTYVFYKIRIDISYFIHISSYIDISYCIPLSYFIFHSYFILHWYFILYSSFIFHISFIFHTIFIFHIVFKCPFKGIHMICLFERLRWIWEDWACVKKLHHWP